MVDILAEKKGEDVILMDIQELTPIADYFVICSGTSDRMLNALAEAVSEGIHDQYDVKGRKEGQPRDGWMVLDYGSVVIHLFSPDQREFYKLEELWNKGKTLLRLQ